MCLQVRCLINRFNEIIILGLNGRMSKGMSEGGDSLPAPHCMALWHKGQGAWVRLLNELSEVDFGR